jgi:Spy/CpxP family protein refolding chaperone
MQKPLITLVGLSAAALLLASGAAAQPFGPDEGERGRGPRGIRAAARFLELTEEQQAVAREAFQKQRPEMEALHEQMREVREALRDSLETEAPDPLAVGELMIEGHALRGQARALREESKAVLESVLTPEQKQKLEALEAVRGMDGPPGMGGRRGERGPRGMRKPGGE